MAMDPAIARIYCIKWFAEIYYHTLPAPAQCNQRADADWESATWIVDRFPPLCRYVARTLTDEDGYAAFVRRIGGEIWDMARTQCECTFLPSYRNIPLLPDQEIDFAIMQVFCMKRFAQIIAQTMVSVETGKERAITDWTEAEKIIATHSSVVDAMAKNGRRRFTDEDGYETFVRQEGEAFWYNVRTLRHLLPRPPYSHATFG